MPYKHRNLAQDELKEFLKVLLHRGYDRGFLCIKVPRRKEFLQFSKYIGGTKAVGLQFDFPLAEWSKGYYGALGGILDREGIQYERQATGEEGVPEFTLVDFERDLATALKLAKLVLQEVFKLDENDPVDAYFHNVSPWDERIGF
jgi:hypothetical protein